MSIVHVHVPLTYQPNESDKAFSQTDPTARQRLQDAHREFIQAVAEATQKLDELWNTGWVTASHCVYNTGSSGLWEHYVLYMYSGEGSEEIATRLFNNRIVASNGGMVN